jgi:hypothetical protein
MKSKDNLISFLPTINLENNQRITFFDFIQE